MRTVFLITLLAVFASGCARPAGVYRSKVTTQPGAQKLRRELVGKWLGESLVRDGGSKMWLSERFEDGTYIVTFKNVARDGSIDVESEYGDWGISGDIYFTMTRGWIHDGKKEPVRHRDSFFDDAYYVKRLTASEFVYESVVNSDRFMTRKVAADYSLR